MARPTLQVPLRCEQVAAANELYRRYLPGWQQYDRILRSLSDHFPSNTDLDCVLPKAVTLNQLYATSVLAITRMAGHIVDVLSHDPPSREADLVESIASLPEVSRSFRSFASKYGHFFIAADRFPILDSFAGDALTYHLGKSGRAHHRNGPFTYHTYLADIEHVRASLERSCTYTELDRYLWLRGQWVAFEKAKHAGKAPLINGEALAQFGTENDRARGLLEEAFAQRT